MPAWHWGKENGGENGNGKKREVEREEYRVRRREERL